MWFHFAERHRQRRIAPGSRVLLILVVCLAPILMDHSVSTAQESTITVCPSGCMYTSIQDGINHAAAGDTVSVGVGVYMETLQLRPGVIVVGANRDTTIVDAAQRTNVLRALENSVGSSPVVRQLTLRNGRASSGAGVLIQAARLTLENVIIERNQASGIGGGVEASSGGGDAKSNSI